MIIYSHEFLTILKYYVIYKDRKEKIKDVLSSNVDIIMTNEFIFD